MEAAASLVCSKVTPLTSTLSPSSYIISFGHFNKHLQCKSLSLKNSLAKNNSRLIATSSGCPLSFVSNCGNLCSSGSVFSSLSTSSSRIIRPVRKLKCSYSSSTPQADSDASNPLLKALKDFSFESLKSSLLQLTPVDICKWCLVFSIAIAISKWTVNLLFNPFFWMYFSWTWLFWPWIVAIGIAIYGAYSFNKYLKGEANPFEQFAVITSAFTWLTLVPPAVFNGFLEGWPFVFFFVYHYLFFLNTSIRRALYGDCYPREHDPKWDISLPNWQKLLFCVGVTVGHWLAAFEGTELHLIPGGWNNVGIWVLIMLTVFMHYHSTWYLAKYSEKVVVPTAVVQFGPYRFVRHPIYASTMLLFVTYFTALRAPLSVLFIIAVCLMYYGQKVKLEEALMLETFGKGYSRYMSKVRYKLIPFVY
ncbi:Farnesyl cysteine-carboxyl methyltransferase [Handroanthus impetiginosus]|uniref:Farnesyl cysteine-carboxyl methyltransferase n=1 Tax=Handroanthus impetiginosus TaxID=429701 RepID=A0A2G9I6B2_9LAMI|nr:Farnesyl cysteine-carboxyl methyltransferase [Handroanthus impetiginosus]